MRIRTLVLGGLSLWGASLAPVRAAGVSLRVESLPLHASGGPVVRLSNGPGLASSSLLLLPPSSPLSAPPAPLASVAPAPAPAPLSAAEAFQALPPASAGFERLSVEPAAAMSELDARFDGSGIAAPLSVQAPVVGADGGRPADWSTLALSPKQRAAAVAAMHREPELSDSIKDHRARFPLFGGIPYKLWHLVHRLKSALTGTAPSLPEAESDAIKHYAGFFYNELNRFLRAEPKVPGPREQGLAAMATLIASGINKLPDHEGTVYRYLWTDDADRHLRYQAGSVVEEAAFSSATRQKRRLYIATGRGGRIAFKFVIRSRTGKSIEHLSFRPYEKEVLFRPGTRFAVRSKERTVTSVSGQPFTQYVIRLEEL